MTDLGSITPHVVQAFSGCDALILEFNHDPVMLAEGPYPYPVKTRVGGAFGHLTNQQARQFLDHADTDKLKVLFVALVIKTTPPNSLMRHLRAGGIVMCGDTYAQVGFDCALDGLDRTRSAGLG